MRVVPVNIHRIDNLCLPSPEDLLFFPFQTIDLIVLGSQFTVESFDNLLFTLFELFTVPATIESFMESESETAPPPIIN